MRSGFTTGACAAAAASAAARRMLGLDLEIRAFPAWTRNPSGPDHPQEPMEMPGVELPFPDGSRHWLPIAWTRQDEDGTWSAGVIKDAGDDPDITHGATIEARVAPAEDFLFRAGEGVGTVTLPGLQIPPGEAAINPGPRAMIRAALEELDLDGALVTVGIEGGRALAERTFNPRLGVVGGLSILGTAGIVRPFSLAAIRATIEASLDVARAAGFDTACLVPGHLGEKAARQLHPFPQAQLIEVSNEWGPALDAAAAKGFRALLLSGHPGKLAKLAEGHFDTHSSRSPSPVPGVAALIRELGYDAAEVPTVEGLFQALPIAARHRLSAVLGARIAAQATRRCGLPCDVLLTTMDGGCYGQHLATGHWSLPTGALS